MINCNNWLFQIMILKIQQQKLFEILSIIITISGDFEQTRTIFPEEFKSQLKSNAKSTKKESRNKNYLDIEQQWIIYCQILTIRLTKKDVCKKFSILKNENLIIQMTFTREKKSCILSSIRITSTSNLYESKWKKIDSLLKNLMILWLRRTKLLIEWRKSRIKK